MAQQVNVLSSHNLNEENIRLVLSTIGVEKAQIDEAVATGKVSFAQATTSKTTFSLSAAFKGLAASLGISTTALLAFSGGIAALGVGIALFAKFHETAEETAEKVSSLMEEYNSAISTANKNAKTVEALSDKYQELSKGVNNLGQNVSLTTDEYNEYNSVVNEIAEMFPNLIKGYTEEGNAILSLKGDVEQLTSAYKEAQQEAYNLLIVSGKDADGNDIISNFNNEAFGITEIFKKDTLGSSNILDILQKLQASAGNGKNYRNALYEIAKLASERNEAYYNEDFQKILNDLGINDFINNKALSAWSDDFMQEQSEKLSKNLPIVLSYIKTYESELETSLSKIQTLGNAYLNSYLLDEKYSGLSEEIKSTASIIVNSIDAGIASSFKNKEDVGAYVVNILESLKENPDIQQALIGLFNTDFSSMTPEQAKAIVDQYINAIADALGENALELKVKLGFENYDTLNDNYQKVLQKATERFSGVLSSEYGNNADADAYYEETKEALENFAKENSINDQDEIAFWNKCIESASTKEEAMKKYLATSTETPTTLSEYLNQESLEDTKEELYELARAGQITEDTFNSTKEYRAILNELGITSEEAAKQLLQMSDLELDMSDWQTQLSNARSSISNLKEILKDISDGQISSESLDKIASDYPQLTQYLSDVPTLTNEVNKLLSEQSEVAQNAGNKLVEYNSNAYNQMKNAAQASLNSITTLHNGQITSLSDMYGIDLDNYSSLAQAKKEIEILLLGEVIGGNIDWYFDTISNILVKRKEENEQWVTIYNQPLETIDDFNFTYDDYLCANGKKFQYAIVTVEHDGTEGNYIYAINKDVDVELEELTITTDFEGITIVGQDEAYTTILEPGDCDTTRNQKVGVVELMYSSKPKVFVNSSVNYETGSTSGFFVKMDDNCQIDLKNSYAYRKEFIDFLTDGRPKFIKSWDGRCWLVMVSGNPTDTTSDHHDIRIIEFEWVEVGDTMSEKDLYEMGFINASEEFWSNYYR